VSTEAQALAALKVILANIDPDPEPAPANIWTYPADHERIRFDTLPVLIASRIINRPAKFTRMTPLGGKHQWPAEILVMLGNGPLLDDRQMALAEVKMSPWPKAMATLLFANQQLTNTVMSIGDADLFTYQVGHIHFWNNIFFGVRFEVLVTQV
jgi:hypothetical protein